jgi:hypothetical protein
MKMAKKKDKDDLVYVGISEPITLRKELLESSKSLVHILKGQEKVKEIRNSKQKAIEQLRGLVADISELLSHTKEIMPNVDDADLPVEKVLKKKGYEKKVKVVKKVIPKPVKAHENGVDKLEMQLRDIEDKLRSL